MELKRSVDYQSTESELPSFFLEGILPKEYPNALGLNISVINSRYASNRVNRITFSRSCQDVWGGGCYGRGLIRPMSAGRV